MTMGKIAWILTALALAAPAQEAPAPAAEYFKDSEATQARPTPNGEALLWMNPLKWTWVNSGKPDAAIYFHHSGIAQARLIVGKGGKSAEEQLAQTVEKVKSLDPKAHIGFTEKRIVNGDEMLCAQIVAGETDKEVVYYGYFFGDADRSVQLVTIVERANLPELYIDLTSLLNGLEIAKKTE